MNRQIIFYRRIPFREILSDNEFHEDILYFKALGIVITIEVNDIQYREVGQCDT